MIKKNDNFWVAKYWDIRLWLYDTDIDCDVITQLTLTMVGNKLKVNQQKTLTIPTNKIR